MFEELKYFKQLLSAGSTGPFGLANLSLGVKTNNLEAIKSPRPEKQKISSIISLWVQELTNQIERGVLSFLKGNLAVSKNQTNLNLQREGTEIITLITIRPSFRLLLCYLQAHLRR